jgi:hypothetical protein
MGASYGVYGTGDGWGGYFSGSGSNSSGVFGSSTGSGYAGGFEGPVVIVGNLTVYGDIDFSGTCTGATCSDERLKKSIEPLLGATAIEKLLKIKGVTYEWKNPDEKHKMREGRQTGVIAQQLAEVFPDWVGTDPDGMRTVVPDARAVVALVVEAIRALKTENDALRAELKACKADTTSRLENLETGAHPLAAGFTSGLGISPGNLGIGLMSVLGCYFVSRRKKDEKAA